MKKNIANAVAHLTPNYCEVLRIEDGDGEPLYRIGSKKWYIVVDTEALQQMSADIAELIGED